MLTDLNWLAPGEVFPPAQEKERLSEYRLNEELWEARLPREWKTAFQALSRKLGKTETSLDTIFGYQQLISKKTADLVCGEPPTVETEQDTDKIVRFLEQQDMFTKLYEAFIDISRFGNAVLKLRGSTVSTASPMNWFPVSDKTDLKTIAHHVIAYPCTPDAEGKMTQLYAEIHQKGSMTSRLYSFGSGRIGSLIEEKTVSTDLDDFAVIPLTNITSSSSIFGLSDYTVINTIVKKLMWRFSCIDNVLDKHAEPSMSGPRSAMTWDEKYGVWYIDLGKYFARDTADSPDLHYVTWDGDLESSFKEAEMLFNQLYILSEMGQAFADAGGGDSSGTALKLRLVSPRVKAARLTRLNDSRIRRLICMLCKLGGISVDYDTLKLHWNEGLPRDEQEEAQTHAVLVQNKLMSAFASMKARGLTDAQIQAEQEQIELEQSANEPIHLGVIDNGS